MKVYYYVKGDAPHLCSHADHEFDTFQDAAEEALSMLHEDEDMTHVWVRGFDGRRLCVGRVYADGTVRKLDY